MNKALSKYGKARWSSTRLSKPHKIRRSIAIVRCAAITAQAYAQINAIKASGDKSERAFIAMGRATLGAVASCASIMKGLK